MGREDGDMPDSLPTIPEEVFAKGYPNLAFHEDTKPQERMTEGQPTVDTERKPKKGLGRKKKEPAKAVGFFQLFRYATGCEVLLMIIGLLCAALHGIALPLMCVVFGQMTDSFVQSGQQLNLTANFTVEEISALLNSTDGCIQIPGVDIQALMTRHAYYFIGIGCAVFLLGTFQVMLFLLTATKQTKRIREKYFHAILHQQMSWFDTHQIGVLNVRLTDDINTINEGLGDKICVFVQFFCTFLSGFIIGFIFGWKLTLVILAVSPLLAGSAAVWSKILATLTSKELSAYAKAGAVAEEILVAIRTVVAFNGQKKAVERYENNLEDAKNFGIKKAITTNVAMGFTQFVIFGTYALAFWYGTKLSVDEPENYTIGKTITVFFSVMIGSFSLGQGAPNLEAIAKARGAAYEVYNTIDQPRPIDSSSKEGHKPDCVKGDIEFKNIHFSYPSRKDVKILQGVNLTVPRGKTIALVGASGCGKSTTIQLLQRFYDPDSGEITLDGRDIRTLNVKWLRENMGIVSQEPVLFGTTIAENIRYGREDATDEDIERAVREANAYDFISKLPDKLNTMVGERGAQLSGGQKQRIAIARALVKNPKILLLDEATSALDTQSESVVQAALDKARAGRTTIVIAHRLSTIRTADVIAGFSNGEVVEQGTHRELMDKKGVYYSLVMQQSQGKPEEEEEDPVEEDNPPKYEDLDDVLYDSSDMDELEVVNEEGIENGGFERNSISSGRVEMKLTRRKSKKSKKDKKNLAKKHSLQEIGWFDDNNNAVGVLTTRLATDASLVKGATGSRLGLATNTVCALTIAIVVAFIHSWQLTLLILACVPFLIGANIIQMRAMAGHASKDQGALEQSGKISTETVENFKTVVGLTREDVFFHKFMDSLERPYQNGLVKAPIYGLTFAVAQAIPYMVNAAIFRFGSWLIAHCHTEYENVFLVFSVIIFAAMNIGESASFAPDFAKAKAAAGRILGLLEKKPEIDIYSEEGEKPTDFVGDIEFRGIHFAYPTRQNVRVLQGLSVSVGPGQTLALVGESGCGKSTSIQLLERFYSPAEGKVLVDGLDTKTLNLSWLRSQLGLVSQEPILFDCSISENIQYGDNSRDVSQDEIEEAAKNANIHDFIMGLPEKYNTRVGDKGTQMSGGQKQRIAIARALVRQPKVLLLDEATSALDTESEKIVQQALDAARQGRTCIVIAHRLSTIQNADQIAVIQYGQVTEQGTHTDLMAKGGAYYALVNAQVTH
ncbi:ATP-dependent translocase ABCB1-like [Salvelinus fontinalis]|uniref:ATP-dependent translocase ABCB1-like n=2 Tax=Salvelinus fontinalis TaxID=8038 RepID=UPI0024863063|nr:ATP-dependent translocase ABCB1-like [Salvelinus fontinalis]